MSTSHSKHLKLSTFGVGPTGSSKISSGGKVPQTATQSPETAEAATATSVQIPIIRGKENAKQLPTFAAIIQRSEAEYVPVEDLDHIQLELETMLSSVAQRFRVLKSEYESLDKDERRNERRNKHGVGGDKPVSPAAAVAVQSGKRKRDEGTTVRKPKYVPTTQKHAKHSKHSPVPLHGTDDSNDYAPSSTGQSLGQARDHNLQKLALPKNDTPNKFWLSVEPYCMPITNEDLRLLDDLLEQYSGPLVPPIPELGEHYSTGWAIEDLKEMQQASNPNRLKQQNNAPASMLKKAESLIDDCVTGPLTQRLVSALMEEQLIQNTGDLTATVESSNSSSENAHMNFRSLAMLRNGIGIEKRVKKELIDLGILDVNDFANNDEDEIHSEIKRLIAELSSVAEYNSTALKRLRKSATEEIKRLEIKRKLDAIDQEILETYKRTMQSKAKRKGLTAEEQQEIFRLTAEQKNLSDQLERAQANCSLYD